METKEFDTVSFVMDYESGELTREEIIAGFQQMINSGVVWKLQGNYGRSAMDLINAGHCTRPGQDSRP